MKKWYAFLGLALLFTSYCYAQTVSTSTNKKAIKEFKKAYKELSNRNFTDAVTYGKLAVKEDTLFVEAYILIAESYSFLKECEYSWSYYRKALDIDIDHSPKTYLARIRKYVLWRP